MARNSMFGMAGAGIAAAIGFIIALNSIGTTLVPPEVSSDGPEIIQAKTNGTSPVPLFLTGSQELRKFNSIDELRSFLVQLNANKGLPGVDFARFTTTLTDEADGALDNIPQPVPPAYSSGAAGGLDVTLDHSSTNVQVKGVDEPDFIKNDGRYAYILSGDKLTIVEVYPAQEARIAAKVALDIQDGQYLQNMFLYNDTLVIFYQEYVEDYVIQEYDYRPSPVYVQKTHALLMDVSDREDPKVLHDYEISGNYNNARLVGDRVYLVTTSDLYDYRNPILPMIKESSTILARPDIYYFDNPEIYYAFNTVTSIDLDGGGSDGNLQSETFMMNPASTLYMSEDNLYIAYQKDSGYPYGDGTYSHDRFFKAILPLLPKALQEEISAIESDPSLRSSEKWDKISDLLQETYNRMPEADRNTLFENIQRAIEEYDAKLYKQSQMTVVHRIKVGSDGLIEYGARGEVPGRLLNQFSMDENNDRFRLATTSEFWSPYGGSVLHNNVYVLNMDMKIVGALEEIAKGESIYSARFMGERLYLVTFERTDPFFVIDLSDDKPKLLGELKLPGYSNYLHPYDKDHIIGLGRETKENQYGGVEILGLKLALFDVSDVENPRVVDVFEIGDRGADSEALYEHKALLFDAEKNILSIPVTITPEYGPAFSGDMRYIQPDIWKGFFVFSIDPDEGFALKGKIEHYNDKADYYYSYLVQGSRSFYIGEVLYTVTLNNLIEMNDLRDLHEINKLEIGTTGGVIRYPITAEEDQTSTSPSSGQ